MKGELFLIRHGKAGSADPNKDDFYRPLTEKGRTEFTTFLQTIQSQIATEGLEVWSSPLTRAKQTAALFTTELELPTYAEKVFLADGNLEACLNALKMKPNFRVACVGHEPFMSMWVHELTGVRTPFHKGAIMCIVFDGAEAKLEWKRSPKS